MPSIEDNALRDVISTIVKAATSDGEERALVAGNRVYANLTVHDSHGVGMIPRHIEAVHTGELQPDQHVSVVVDDGPMLGLDGNAGYGQVIGGEATEVPGEPVLIPGEPERIVTEALPHDFLE